jgi:hypothetical protein
MQQVPEEVRLQYEAALQQIKEFVEENEMF